MGCAECHDHKFDPFAARDFYRMAAFFADVKQWGVYMDYNYTPNPDLRGFSNDHPFPPEIEVESPYLKRQNHRARWPDPRPPGEPLERPVASRGVRAWRLGSRPPGPCWSESPIRLGGSSRQRSRSPQAPTAPIVVQPDGSLLIRRQGEDQGKRLKVRLEPRAGWVVVDPPRTHPARPERGEDLQGWGGPPRRSSLRRACGTLDRER